MKQILFFLMVMAPVVGWGQMHGGLQVAIQDCGLNGHFTLPQGGTIYTAGAWGEFLPKEWFGLKIDLSYTQRKGRTEGHLYSSDAVLFSSLFRFHSQDRDSNARFLFGAGAFFQFPFFKADGLSRTDVGPCLELGVEFGRISVVISGQAGVTDVVEAVPKRQRWVAAGIGLQGRIW